MLDITISNIFHLPELFQTSIKHDITLQSFLFFDMEFADAIFKDPSNGIPVQENSDNITTQMNSIMLFKQLKDASVTNGCRFLSTGKNFLFPKVLKLY